MNVDWTVWDCLFLYYYFRLLNKLHGLADCSKAEAWAQLYFFFLVGNWLWIYSLYIFIYIYPPHPGENICKAVVRGESLLYSKQKKFRTWTLQGALECVCLLCSPHGSVAFMASGKLAFLNTRYPCLSHKLVNSIRKITIRPMYPYTDTNKTSKMEILHHFMGPIKRLLSFLCLMGNGRRPPNSFHKGCYKSSSQ